MKKDKSVEVETLYRNPFVIFCKKCNKILSDSFSLRNYKENFLIFENCTISSKNEKNIEKEFIEIFKNCTYREICCECKSVVGVFLITANKKFNGMSENYFIYKEKVKSYSLGNKVTINKTLEEVIEDIERIKYTISKIYNKVFN